MVIPLQPLLWSSKSWCCTLLASFSSSFSWKSYLSLEHKVQRCATNQFLTWRRTMLQPDQNWWEHTLAALEYRLFGFHQDFLWGLEQRPASPKWQRPSLRLWKSWLLINHQLRVQIFGVFPVIVSESEGKIIYTLITFLSIGTIYYRTFFGNKFLEIGGGGGFIAISWQQRPANLYKTA